MLLANRTKMRLAHVPVQFPIVEQAYGGDARVSAGTLSASRERVALMSRACWRVTAPPCTRLQQRKRWLAPVRRTVVLQPK